MTAGGGCDREADTSGNIRRVTEFDPEPTLARIGSSHSPRGLKNEKQPFIMRKPCLRLERQLRSDSGHWHWLDVLQHSVTD
jgi:hypothetical protein